MKEEERWNFGCPRSPLTLSEDNQGMFGQILTMYSFTSRVRTNSPMDASPHQLLMDDQRRWSHGTAELPVLARLC